MKQLTKSFSTDSSQIEAVCNVLEKGEAHGCIGDELLLIPVG